MSRGRVLCILGSGHPSWHSFENDPYTDNCIRWLVGYWSHFLRTLFRLGDDSAEGQGHFKRNGGYGDYFVLYFLFLLRGWIPPFFMRKNADFSVKIS